MRVGLRILDESRLAGLLEAGRGLVAQLEVDAVLEELLRVACDLTGARYTAIGVLDEDRRRLERFVTRGIDRATHQAIGDLSRISDRHLGVSDASTALLVPLVCRNTPLGLLAPLTASRATRRSARGRAAVPRLRGECGHGGGHRTFGGGGCGRPRSTRSASRRPSRA